MTEIKVGSTPRRRVLLFDGDDEAVALAAPALAGIGIDLVRLEAAEAAAESGPFESTPQDVLAVVVGGRGPDTNALLRNLRNVSYLPVLLLAKRMQDDVLFQ